jgi:hypothetical protein
LAIRVKVTTGDSPAGVARKYFQYVSEVYEEKTVALGEGKSAVVESCMP